MKLKVLHFADVAEIQEAVIDELKKFQKEQFSAAFQKMNDLVKACIYVCVFAWSFTFWKAAENSSFWAFFN